MNRIKKIIIVIFTGILVTACFNNKPYIEIKYDKFIEKIENKETFIFYIGSSECKYCVKFEKALKRVVDEYDVDVYYINTAEDKMTVEERKDLNDIVNYGGTPTTIFVVEGEVQSKYNRINGAVSSEKIIELFKRNGYIK